jgi:hypothetical protein
VAAATTGRVLIPRSLRAAVSPPAESSATDRIAGDVAETPVSPKEILATTYHLLGIDPAATLIDHMGRPRPIAGEGKVREELLV